MSARRILVLGGYGMAGMPLARLLLRETDVSLVLAGRCIDRAERAAAELNAEFQGDRVSATCADASVPDSLNAAFQDVGFVLVASSTARYVRQIATAALRARIDYLDIHYSNTQYARLQPLAQEIERAGLCFITEAGFHPGLPAAMVRYAALGFDRLDSATVGSVINQGGGLPLTDGVYELVEEFKDYRALVYKDGAWRESKNGGMADAIRIDFGSPFGRRNCFPMFLEEMRAMPEMLPSLRETGFYIAGFNWFADWFVMPLMMVAMKLFPRVAVKPMGRLLCWSTRAFSSPPYGIVMRVEAAGEKGGQPKSVEVSLFHDDGYLFTAIPVVACLLQYLDGSLRRPGLWMMGHMVAPSRLVNDMERMGVKISGSEDGG